MTGTTRDWAALEAEQALVELGSSTDGLSTAEAEARLTREGPNQLQTTARRSALRRLLDQFNNLLIYVLLVAAGLAWLSGHGIDALVILAVVIVNTTIGFIQEGRAEDALAAIRSLIDPQATVRRDGRRQTIPAANIVPGDIVLIEAGDRVVADLRLVRAHNLKLDEAALTGESVPVDKQAQPVDAGTALADCSSMAWSGTFVSAGAGAGVVVATGSGTELGRISGMLQAVVQLKTPLLRQMDRLARQITLVVLAAAIIVFGIAYGLRGFAAVDAFMAVVGLFVSAIPEGLPAIMTITLAIGVQRMAARKAIIRRLPAVETLGAVSVICSDKTGTLTRNEMSVHSLATATEQVAAENLGAASAGTPAMQALLRCAVLCNDAELGGNDAEPAADGDPMEAALLLLAVAAGLNVRQTRSAQPRIDSLPFDSAHKFMATLHPGSEDSDEQWVYIKGAPEALIELAGTELGADGPVPIDRQRWHEHVSALAAQGERVLAFATCRWRPDEGPLDASKLCGKVMLAGLAGFIDPPRPEAISAVAACQTAGIRLIMITGDHALTAHAVASTLGLAADPQVLTGADIDALSDAALKDAALRTHVFARTTPAHKLRLVEALQADGLTVAMTGDGVNDAPALKRADVGVAMGRKGTEAAKEASDMVLADDNFASIVAAVREGRTVYDNLKKTILFLLPINGGEGMTILFAILAGLELPVTPVQILWVNMVSSVALAMVLAFEPTEPGTMRAPPRPAAEPLLTGTIVWRIIFISLLFLLGAFGMFAWAMGRGLPLELARTMVVNTIVMMEIFYLFSVRYTYGAALTWRGVIGTPAVLLGISAVVVLQFTFTYAPFMTTFFATAPVALVDGLVIVGVGIALLLVVEGEKRLRRAFGRTD